MDLDAVFPFRRTSPRPRVRLFCLPFAGGSAMLYRAWPGRFDADVDVCPIELPGRGLRSQEVPMSSMPSLVGQLADAMRPFLDVPVAIFGHSMGARIAFELAKRLGERVTRLFVSASPAPDKAPEQSIAHLGDVEFRRRIAAKGGTPREILDDDELMELFLPVLRADFAMIEAYRGSDDARVACPLTAFAGTNDREVEVESVRQWCRFTTGPFRLVEIPADHFYLERARNTLTREIAQSIESSMVESTRDGSGRTTPS